MLRLVVHIFQVPRVGSVHVVQAGKFKTEIIKSCTRDGVEIDVREVALGILKEFKYFKLGRLNEVSPFILVGEKLPEVHDDKSRVVSEFIVIFPNKAPEIRNLGRLTEVKLASVDGAIPSILPPTYIRFGAEKDVIDDGILVIKDP